MEISDWSGGTSYFSRNKKEWIIIFGFGLCVLFLLVLGFGRLLILLFPLGAILVGVYLYFNAPVFYIGYTLWLWFLNPLIRRIIDFQSGYYTTGGLYTTAHFVTFIVVITFIKDLPRVYNKSGLPFVLCAGVISFATLSGFAQQSLRDFLIVTSILNWICPVIFGFHLFASWRDYPAYRQAIERVLFFGLLVMSVYGIYQFVVAPGWDRFWLEITSLHSRGKPEPFGIRVWSTMSAAHQFAFPMIAGMVLLFKPPTKLPRFLLFALSSVTLLLTRVRTAWFCLVLCLFVYVTSLKPKYQAKIVFGLGVALVLIVAFLSIEEFNDVISQRVDSLSSLGEDRALDLRADAYNQVLDLLLFNVIGSGFGSSIRDLVLLSDGDTSFLSMLLWFGLLGTLLYVLGVVLCVSRLLIERTAQKDPFFLAARTICLGLLPMSFTGQLFPSAGGMIFWGFMGMGLAAGKYYQEQALLRFLE